METSIFVMVFIGFLARGMIGTLIQNLLKTDLLLFCTPVNLMGAAYFMWALVWGNVEALHVGFFMSDLILTTLILCGSKAKP